MHLSFGNCVSRGADLKATTHRWPSAKTRADGSTHGLRSVLPSAIAATPTTRVGELSTVPIPSNVGIVVGPLVAGASFATGHLSLSRARDTLARAEVEPTDDRIQDLTTI